MKKLQMIAALFLVAGTTMITASHPGLGSHHTKDKNYRKLNKQNAAIAARRAASEYSSEVIHPEVKENTTRGSKGLRVDKFKELAR